MNPTGTLTREQAIITLYKTFTLCLQEKGQDILTGLDNGAALSVLPSLTRIW